MVFEGCLAWKCLGRQPSRFSVGFKAIAWAGVVSLGELQLSSQIQFSSHCASSSEAFLQPFENPFNWSPIQKVLFLNAPDPTICPPPHFILTFDQRQQKTSQNNDHVWSFNMRVFVEDEGWCSVLSSDRTATQNLIQTRKGKKTAGKDFKIFRESA